MAQRALIDDLQKICKSIAELLPKKEELVRRRKWGEITFVSIELEIENIFWLVEEIGRSPIHSLPDHVVQNTTSHLNAVKETIDEIDAFNIAQGDASSRRDDISNRFVGYAQNAMSEIGIWIPLLALRTGKMEHVATTMKNTTADLIRNLDETRKYIEESKSRIDEAVLSARGVAAEAGAAKFTHEFRDEAKAVGKRSRRWLYLTGIFSASALALSILLTFGLIGEIPSNTWEAVYRL